MAAQTAAMRTPMDRIRHVVFFELTLLCTVTPLLAYTMNRPAVEMGALSFGMSMFAMAWNYAYNVMFDHALLKLGRPLYPRSFKMRIVHVMLFECGFIGLAVPVFMIVLNLTFWKAFMMEMGFVFGVPVIAFVYNYLYDRIFPPPMIDVIDAVA